MRSGELYALKWDDIECAVVQVMEVQDELTNRA